MDRSKLEAAATKVISALPTDLEGLVDRGRAMEQASYNPEGAVPIREHLDSEVKGGLFYNFSDGGGNSDSLWIIPGHDGLEALYLVYDHESDMNFYAFESGEDYENQWKLYRDLPLNLQELLSNGPEGELLTISNPDKDCALYHGSAVLFLQDGQWQIPEGYYELGEQSGDNGGLSYIFDPEEERED